MISKVVCFALVALAVAGQEYGHHHGHDHGHDHGHHHDHHHHATSSQSIVRHDTPVHHDHGHDTHGHGHDTHGHGHDTHGHDDHHVDYYAHPKYEFEYKVEDLHTKDIKGQHESRDGDKVHGFYYLHQPDGHTRHVDYHADKHDGFHADVKFKTAHESHHHHY